MPLAQAGIRVERYHRIAEQIVELAARGQGSLVGSIVTHDRDVAREFVLGAAHQHGRILVLDRDTFIMTLPNDPLSVQRFWAFAKPGLARHGFASDTPIRCKDGKWDLAEIPR